MRKLNKNFIILSTLCSFIFSFNLFSNDPTAKLFKAIADNSFEEVNNAINEGANLASKEPINNNTPLYEALQNYYKQVQKPFKLNAAKSLLTGATFLGSVVLVIASLKIYRDKESDSGTKETASIVGMLYFISACISLASTHQFTTSSIKIKKKIVKSLSILNLIYNEMYNKGIVVDQKSIDFIIKLNPQVKAAFKSYRMINFNEPNNEKITIKNEAI